MSNEAEYEIHWAQCPTNYNPTKCMFIHANDADDARKMAREKIKREHGIAEFSIMQVLKGPSELFNIMVYDDEWGDIGEGSFDTAEEAVSFARSEVGLPWIVVQGRTNRPHSFGDARGLCY